jgi:hypothetical protein
MEEISDGHIALSAIESASASLKIEGARYPETDQKLGRPLKRHEVREVKKIFLTFLRVLVMDCGASQAQKGSHVATKYGESDLSLLGLSRQQVPLPGDSPSGL